MYDMNIKAKANKAFSRDLHFLQAISTGQNEFQGIILEKVPKSEGIVKVKIYISDWKRTISANYKSVSENRILSKDEKTEIDVTDYRAVSIKCAFNVNSRNWKERVIINII